MLSERPRLLVRQPPPSRLLCTEPRSSYGPPAPPVLLPPTAYLSCSPSIVPGCGGIHHPQWSDYYHVRPPGTHSRIGRYSTPWCRLHPVRHDRNDDGRELLGVVQHTHGDLCVHCCGAAEAGCELQFACRCVYVCRVFVSVRARVCNATWLCAMFVFVGRAV